MKVGDLIRLSWWPYKTGIVVSEPYKTDNLVESWRYTLIDVAFGTEITVCDYDHCVVISEA